MTATAIITEHARQEACRFAEMARAMEREAERAEARGNTGAAFTARCEATRFHECAAQCMRGER